VRRSRAWIADLSPPMTVTKRYRNPRTAIERLHFQFGLFSRRTRSKAEFGSERPGVTVSVSVRSPPSLLNCCTPYPDPLSLRASGAGSYYNLPLTQILPRAHLPIIAERPLEHRHQHSLPPHPKTQWEWRYCSWFTHSRHVWKDL